MTSWYSDGVSDSSQFRLLSERRFAPFFATQFLGAFNDNVFRNGLIIVITFQGVQVFGLNASQLANIAGAMTLANCDGGQSEKDRAVAKLG